MEDQRRISRKQHWVYSFCGLAGLLSTVDQQRVLSVSVCSPSLPYLNHMSCTNAMNTVLVLSGGYKGYNHSVPGRIAVNMILCCASGGTLAVIIASWAQVCAWW